MDIKQAHNVATVIIAVDAVVNLAIDSLNSTLLLFPAVRDYLTVPLISTCQLQPCVEANLGNAKTTSQEPLGCHSQAYLMLIVVRPLKVAAGTNNRLPYATNYIPYDSKFTVSRFTAVIPEFDWTVSHNSSRVTGKGIEKWRSASCRSMFIDQGSKLSVSSRVGFVALTCCPLSECLFQLCEVLYGFQG